MSDDEADPELLALLAQSLGLGSRPEAPPSTGVLKSAEYVYDNALDVSISSQGSKAAAELLYHQLRRRQYSTREWAKHELHPKPSGGEATVNFIFIMNLLNFSFWSELPEGERFAVDYNGKRWTGYWSLVAALQRALDEGHPITTPSFWSTCSEDTISQIFRSTTAEPIPLLNERITLLRTASTVLSDPTTSPLALIDQANHSAARLVNLLTTHLPSCFADTTTYRGRTVHLHKRAQILVADLWACFNGSGLGAFDDIDTALTMFADYRVPQMLQRLGVLWYSPRLEGKVRRGEMLEAGSELEVEVRACSVWAVELLRREMERRGCGEWEVEVEDHDEDKEHVGSASASVDESRASEPHEGQAGDLQATTEATTGEQAAVTDETVDHSANSGTEDIRRANPPQTSNATAPPPPAAEPRNEAVDPSAAPASFQQAQPEQQKTKPAKKIQVKLNAVLLDYLLYDTAKEQEKLMLEEIDAGGEREHGPDGPNVLPHHRTRSIWY